MIDKHAYCILAHNNFHQLQTLINCIDDERNDIYLHIDKKAEKDYNELGGVSARYSQLVLVKSTDIRWSDVSLCDAEFNLFHTVMDSGIAYNRIHLISGSDLPLVSQDEIHRLFLNNNKEYIDVVDARQFEKRLKYYHFFVKYRRNNPLIDFARRVLLLVQLPFVNRRKKSQLKYAYGSEWCSLTYEAVKTIVDNYLKVRPEFRYTTCSDEHYKQMILLSAGNFKFAKEGCLRYVDFSEHNPSPRVLTVQDLNKIMSSHCIFARKFEERIDSEVIKLIVKIVANKSYVTINK